MDVSESLNDGVVFQDMVDLEFISVEGIIRVSLHLIEKVTNSEMLEVIEERRLRNEVNEFDAVDSHHKQLKELLGICSLVWVLKELDEILKVFHHLFHQLVVWLTTHQTFIRNRLFELVVLAIRAFFGSSLILTLRIEWFGGGRVLLWNGSSSFRCY